MSFDLFLKIGNRSHITQRELVTYLGLSVSCLGNLESVMLRHGPFSVSVRNTDILAI